jgi:hypothetical protein
MMHNDYLDIVADLQLFHTAAGRTKKHQIRQQTGTRTGPKKCRRRQFFWASGVLIPTLTAGVSNRMAANDYLDFFLIVGKPSFTALRKDCP